MHSCRRPVSESRGVEAPQEVKCVRSFRRKGDLKCTSEQSKPVEQQTVAEDVARSSKRRTRDPHRAVLQQDRTGTI